MPLRRKRCLSVRRIKNPSLDDLGRIETLVGQLERSLTLLRNTPPGPKQQALYVTVRAYSREYKHLTGKGYQPEGHYELEG